MANNISPELLAQFFGQVSDDPFLMLVTLSHDDFDTIYLCNNTVDQTSRGQAYTAFPMTVRLPADDGESTREVSIEFDNVSLELINEIRSVTSAMDVKIEMVLASDLDTVQLSLEDLKMRGVNYDKQKVTAKLFMDNFLNGELTSEKYLPSNFPGLF